MTVMRYPELLNRFYEMESKEKLFDITDKKCVYIWDIVRYYVFTNLLWHKNNSDAQNKNRKRLPNILNIFDCLIRNIYILLFIKRKYFFFTASRNKYDFNKYFDQNAYNTIKLFHKNQCIIDESYLKSKKHIYSKYLVFSNSSIIYKLLSSKTGDFSFDSIKNIVDKYFPENSISVNCLENEYKRFYKEMRYFHLLFKRIRPSIVFVTQNGIRKGLYAAADILKIPTIEFNHGIVYDGHMAYSYPRTQGIKNYSADYIFKLGDFWFKDMFLPNSKLVNAGNDYFVPKINEDTKLCKNKILVISSDVMGILLKDFIIKLHNEYPEYNNYHFIFKLHPNQFSEKERYISYLKKFSNVEVITDEMDVPECMQTCRTMFTIQSTAAFEALQMNRKVILLRRLSYETMQVLFNEANLYLVDSPSEFNIAINRPIINSSQQYFEPYNQNKVLEEINKILEDGK